MNRAAIAAALLSLTLSVAPGSHVAAQAYEQYGASRTLTVAKDKSMAFHLSAPATEVVVSQPDIAEIVATTDHSFYVRGKALGATNILVYGPGKRLNEVIDIKVSYDIDSLQHDLDTLFPTEHIHASSLADGILLSGDVSTNTILARAKAVAERYAPKNVSCTVNVSHVQQVVLEVRVIEASRRALSDFGLSLDASNRSGLAISAGSGILSGQASAGTLQISSRIGTGNLTATLQALESKGVIRTLAKPNLVAVSGEEASFLAGGEFPFPIPGPNQTIAIDFRQYGVNLKFTPVVADNGLIRMKVAPEVSQLDTQNAVRIAGVNIPALTVRKTSTTVELRAGQSLAIAGMFQQGYQNSVRQVPGLGDVPVLGALFKSTEWQRNETELVIIVTPKLGGDEPDPIENPLEAGREPTAIDLILEGLAMDKPLTGPVGAKHGKS